MNRGGLFVDKPTRTGLNACSIVKNITQCIRVSERKGFYEIDLQFLVHDVDADRNTSRLCRRAEADH